MTDQSDWEGRTGLKWAEEWRRTDRSFGGLTDMLLRRASARPIQKALDVGCGAGELSLALARGHPAAQVIGLDISPSLVDVARERGARLANVSFEKGDAARWSGSGAGPDLVVSRHGLMFFERPVEAFANLAEQATDNARLVFSCFRARTENPWASQLTDLLPENVSDSVDPADPAAPGPFAFGDSSRVAAILSEAGWTEIDFEPLDYAYIAGSGENAVEDAQSYFLAIGPLAREAAGLPAEQRAEVIERLQRFVESNCAQGIIALPAAAWIVTARRSG